MELGICSLRLDLRRKVGMATGLLFSRAWYCIYDSEKVKFHVITMLGCAPALTLKKWLKLRIQLHTKIDTFTFQASVHWDRAFWTRSQISVVFKCVLNTAFSFPAKINYNLLLKMLHFWSNSSPIPCLTCLIHHCHDTAMYRSMTRLSHCGCCRIGGAVGLPIR